MNNFAAPSGQSRVHSTYNGKAFNLIWKSKSINVLVAENLYITAMSQHALWNGRTLFAVQSNHVITVNKNLRQHYLHIEGIEV